jgi:glycosyltransferase involved in cell wall biosynthesis
VPRSKITVAYQAPSPVFKPRDKSSAKERLERAYGIHCPFILYVGRLQARKNLIRLSEAFARVRNQHFELKLVLVGKADLGYDKLQARISELNLNDAVIFPGYVPSDDLPLFYNAAEMLVFPSLFEGFGLPVMEAMASGVPTITSEGSCLAEIAGSGASLVDPMSVDSIARAMARVLEDAGLRGELVERGLQRSACFSTARFAAKILDVYKSLAG